jgi:tripartite-type tricarboxylate transporter receptor subunit TctC
MIDLTAGHVVVAVATMLTGLPQVKSGRLRGLGVTGTGRSNVLPELPTIAEAGVPGYEAVQWYGMFAPAQTPREIITRLHLAMTAVLQSPAVKERLANDGTQPVGSTPEEFSRYLRSEIDKWAQVVRIAGIKPQ